MSTKPHKEVSAYAIEVYEENCSLNEMVSVLINFARDFGCSLVVSPLHNKDLHAPNIDGVRLPKKNHWHVLIHKSGTVEKKDVDNISVVLGGNAHSESVDNEYGYFKYLKHDTLKCVREGKPKYNDDYAFYTLDYKIPVHKGSQINDLIALIGLYYFPTYEDFVSYVADNYPEYVNTLSSHVVRDYYYSYNKQIVGDKLALQDNKMLLKLKADKNALEIELAKLRLQLSERDKSEYITFNQNPFLSEEEKNILQNLKKIVDKNNQV